MKISIIGAGKVGSALAGRWSKAGHEIVFGVRHPEEERVKRLAEQLDRAEAKSITQSIIGTDAIVVAIPAHFTAALGELLGRLEGRILIDTTNSVFRKPDPYSNGFEALSHLTGAEMVKCFNSTGAENMKDPLFPMPDGSLAPADMFVAGDSAEAKAVAIQLANDAGFQTYDFGGNAQVPMLEELCRIWIHLAIGQKMGRGIAFKLLRR